MKRIAAAGVLIVALAAGGIGWASAQTETLQPYVAVDPPTPSKDATQEELQALSDAATDKMLAFKDETGLVPVGLYQDAEGEVAAYLIWEQVTDPEHLGPWDLVTLERTVVGQFGRGAEQPSKAAVLAVAEEEAAK